MHGDRCNGSIGEEKEQRRHGTTKEGRQARDAYVCQEGSLNGLSQPYPSTHLRHHIYGHYCYHHHVYQRIILHSTLCMSCIYFFYLFYSLCITSSAASSLFHVLLL